MPPPSSGVGGVAVVAMPSSTGSTNTSERRMAMPDRAAHAHTAAPSVVTTGIGASGDADSGSTQPYTCTGLKSNLQWVVTPTGAQHTCHIELEFTTDAGGAAPVYDPLIHQDASAAY